MDGPVPLQSFDATADPIDYLIERASVAIGRLDALVSGSSVASAWQLRAAWTGYARALRLQGVEVDDVDVFSWGSGVVVPGRPRLHTIVDHFAAFAPWRGRLQARGRHWAEDLPFSVRSEPGRSRQPMLLRALALQTDYLKAAPSIEAWLMVPVSLYRLGLSEAPLPCLVAGDRQLLFAARARDRGPALRRVLRSLESAALAGCHSLKAIQDAHAISVAALASEHRPTALRRLTALLMVAPIQSPDTVSRRLRITLSGAGKLLSRAEGLGIVHEVSGRRAWRIYIVPDLAIALGFVAAAKGRPSARPTQHEPSRGLASILADFDREMAVFDANLNATSNDERSP